MIDEQEVMRLGGGRWIVPVLALIIEQDGARFADLLLGLGIARESLSRTLTLAIDNGWLARNAGYGHPLRPEYVLTERGRVVAAACARMMAVRRRLGLAPDYLPRWSLPILGRLQHNWTRFSDLRTGLAPVTPRALSTNLKQMIEGQIVLRRVEAVFPPTPLYGLAPWGQQLACSLRPG
jgi:DNA-binding HxlR family transcriptional regulator